MFDFYLCLQLKIVIYDYYFSLFFILLLFINYYLCYFQNIIAIFTIPITNLILIIINFHLIILLKECLFLVFLLQLIFATIQKFINATCAWNSLKILISNVWYNKSIQLNFSNQFHCFKFVNFQITFILFIKKNEKILFFFLFFFGKN